MQILHVEEIKGLVGNGCTNPFLAFLKNDDNEIKAVLKTKDNPQGVLALINEFISYNIAVALGLKMPNSGVALVDESTILNIDGITEEDFGTAFYSEYIDKVRILNDGNINSVEDKQIFEHIILFDHIIYNKDRNKGNLLITSTKNTKEIYIIDHTHVFKNQTIWDGNCLKRGISENDYLDTNIMEDNEHMYDIFNQSKKIDKANLLKTANLFKTIINKELLDKITTMLPSDWEIQNNDIEILKEYLLYRVENIDKICEIICNYYGGE